MMSLKWLDVQDIAIELADNNPDRDPLTINFVDLRDMVMALEDFEDDPSMDRKTPMHTPIPLAASTGSRFRHEHGRLKEVREIQEEPVNLDSCFVTSGPDHQDLIRMDSGSDPDHLRIYSHAAESN